MICNHTEEIWVRVLNWNIDVKPHDSNMLLVRNWKGQNTGGALAVTKGLVGQVEGPVGKFPSSTLYGKNALVAVPIRRGIAFACTRLTFFQLLPRVRTTRFKSSFINYAVDHYVWSRLILKCLIIVSCRCSNERVNVLSCTIYICEYFVILHFHVYFAMQP